MDVRLYCTGKQFENGIELESSLIILSAFNKIYGECLSKIVRRHSSPTMRIPDPSLKFSHIKSGSLDASFFVDIQGFLASAFPLVPQTVHNLILSHSWNLIKDLFTLLKYCVEYFKRNNKPPAFQIFSFGDSNTNIAISGDGNTITVSPELIKTAKKCHSSVRQITDMMSEENIQTFQLENPNSTDPKIEITHQNKSSFVIDSIDKKDESPIEIICSIFNLNTKNNHGQLEYFDDVESKANSVRFTIHGGAVDDYIEALRSDRSKVLAVRDFTVNALGESKINNLILHGITNIND